MHLLHKKYLIKKLTSERKLRILNVAGGNASCSCEDFIMPHNNVLSLMPSFCHKGYEPKKRQRLDSKTNVFKEKTLWNILIILNFKQKIF